MDDVLKERFAELRAEEARQAPAFQDMLARARAAGESPAETPSTDSDIAPDIVSLEAAARERSTSGPRRWFWVAGPLIAAGLAAVLLLGPNQEDAEFEALVTAFAQSTSDWNAPTDDLLRVPGMDLLNTMPTIDVRIGSPPDGAVLPPPRDETTG